MSERLTVKGIKKRLCDNCIEQKARIRTVLIGFDKDGNPLYERHKRKCHLRPVTSDGRECPYFKPRSHPHQVVGAGLDG